MSKSMNEPSGRDILALLIALYADQEGVEVTYEILNDPNDNTQRREAA